jgi:hypothetical protein
VDVLVLISVGGLLIALFFCLISRTRETPGRMLCTNNLKQLSLAFHTYHDANGYLPTESGSNPSFYQTMLPFVEQTGATPNTPIRLYVCPTRFRSRLTPGRRDYGYAASTGSGSAGTSILDAPQNLTLKEITEANGASITLLMSHLWMDPKTYTGGDPTDLGWSTKNNSRSINEMAIPDVDPKGSVSHIGSPHPKVMPSAFADGHTQVMPYTYPQWAQLWAYDGKIPATLP